MNASKSRAQYRIKQRIKYSDTSIELAVDKLFKDKFPKLRLQKNLMIQTIDPADLPKPTATIWTLWPDRRILGTDILIHCDGEKYHSSKIQRKKDAWRDKLYEKVGMRNLHIPGQLLVAKGVKNSRAYWLYVEDNIREFMQNVGEKTRYILA